MIRQGIMTSKTNSITKEAGYGSNWGFRTHCTHLGVKDHIVKGHVIEFSIRVFS